DDLARFGEFVPAADDFRTRPRPETQARYSDEQLFALATYLYSLAPPENPNTPDALSARGKEVFNREDCGRCHTPPRFTDGELFTEGKLMPVVGFGVPEGHRERFH